MNPCELSIAVSALASSIATGLSDDDLDLLAAILVQLGDTLATISTQRARLKNCCCQGGASPSTIGPL